MYIKKGLKNIEQKMLIYQSKRIFAFILRNFYRQRASKMLKKG